MRIGIDIRSLQNESQNRGIGTYGCCLIRSLLSIDKENEYVFFVFGNLPLPALLSEDIFKDVNIKKVTSKIKYFALLPGQVLFPYAIRKERLDIFHSPEHILPIFSSCKKVITIHDFISSEYEIYRKRQNLISKMYYYLKYKSARYADRIIAVSECTKKKIMQFVGIKEDRIRVIYEAAQDNFKPVDDKELFLRLREKYKIDVDFILYVGAITPHKNIGVLIKAFGQRSFKDFGLVLAGIDNDKEYLTYINMLVGQLKLKERVYILGHIPQEDLVGFYNMARLVISVSLHEGFGLPILEAMACGRPVIASGNTSMREIVDSSGILIDPHNIKEIASTINNLLSNEELRNILSKKGLERAKEFSWQKTAKETIALYQVLLR